MSMNKCYIVAFILCTTLVYTCSSATVEYYLAVNNILETINGLEKAITTYNSSKIGPTLRAKQGDTLKVTVINQLPSEATTVHWHGIHQLNTPYMDGVPHGTQCPIFPGESMTYTFVLDKAGTYWYHSHYDVQRNDAAFGALIVDTIEPYPYKYDEEIILIFSDWYNDYGVKQCLLLEATPFRWVGSPNYLLVNGELDHNITVTAGKTYLVRFISAAALSWYNITIPGHQLTLVESQGDFLKPLSVSALWLNTGERYSALLNASNPGCYQIGISMLDRVGPTGKAFLNYEGSNCNTTAKTAANSSEVFNPNNLHSLHNPTLPTPTRQLTIAIRQVLNVTSGGIKWTLNNITAKMESTPVLFSVRNNRGDLLKNSNLIELKLGEVVDITFVNMNRWDGGQEQHGLHIHGHSAWFLGSGLNSSEPKVLNLVDPPLLDTWTLPRNSWVVVRLVANNPGAWLFHCHATFHMKMGMFLYFVYPSNTIPAPPPNFDSCGDNKMLGDNFPEPVKKPKRCRHKHK